jgi:hypothetical protein
MSYNFDDEHSGYTDYDGDSNDVRNDYYSGYAKPKKVKLVGDGGCSDWENSPEGQAEMARYREKELAAKKARESYPDIPELNQPDKLVTHRHDNRSEYDSAGNKLPPDNGTAYGYAPPKLDKQTGGRTSREPKATREPNDHQQKPKKKDNSEPRPTDKPKLRNNQQKTHSEPQPERNSQARNKPKAPIPVEQQPAIRLSPEQKLLSNVPSLMLLAFDMSKSMSKFSNNLVCYNSLKRVSQTFENQPLVGALTTFGQEVNVQNQGRLMDVPGFKAEDFEWANLQNHTRLYDAIIVQVELARQLVAKYSHPDLPAIRPYITVVTDGVNNYGEMETAKVKAALDSIAHLKPELMFGGFPPRYLLDQGLSIDAEETLRKAALDCGFPSRRIVIVPHNEDNLSMTDSMNKVMKRLVQDIDCLVGKVVDEALLAKKRTSIFNRNEDYDW